MSKIDYDRKVTVVQDGRRVKKTLNEIQIKDLWHVAISVERARALLEEVERRLDKWLDDHAERDVGKDAYGAISACYRLLSKGGDDSLPESAFGKRQKDAILDTWHVAHDLKKALAGDDS